MVLNVVNCLHWRSRCGNFNVKVSRPVPVAMDFIVVWCRTGEKQRMGTEDYEGIRKIEDYYTNNVGDYCIVTWNLVERTDQMSLVTQRHRLTRPGGTKE